MRIKNLFIIFMAMALFGVSCKKQDSKIYISISGKALGTFYNISYSDPKNRNLQLEIDSVLNKFNSSLSAYDKNSILSKVNQNEDIDVDSLFINVFKSARYFYEITNGAFDISGSPFFSAWGFGFGNKEKITPELIDSLKQFVGMDKIWLEGKKVVKSDSRVKINANAIAKGYAVDVVANYLLQNGINNFLVEIGGEIVVKGKNSKNKDWVIGIDRPYDGNFAPGEDIMHKITISDKAVASSGNYRQFYIENGKKFAHTIDPRTGYPVQHSLLSATVIAKNCMSADAVATSLMVMGIDNAKKFVGQHPEYKVYLIYEENGEYKEFETIK